MIELLKDKNYIRYWTAVVVSFLGDAITLTTVVYLIGSQTGSALMISLVMIAQLLPMILLGPLIGPLVDRWQRKYVLVAADIYRFIIVLLMIPYNNSVLVLSFLLFLLGIGTAFFEPARIASVPLLVGQHRIPEGIALFQSTSAIIKFAGPVLAGILIEFFDVKLVFAYDAFSYMTSAILLSSLGVLTAKPLMSGREVRIWHNALDSIKTIFNMKEIRTLIGILLPIMFVSGIVMTNYKGAMLVDLKMSAIQFGWVEALFAVGFVSGALQGPKLLQRFTPIRLLQLSVMIIFICCVCMFLLAQFRSLVLIFIWSAMLGFGESLIQVPASNLILQKIPSDMRGRGVAITNSFMNACFVSGFVVGGESAAMTGTLTTFFLAAVICIIIYIFVRRRLLWMKSEIQN